MQEHGDWGSYESAFTLVEMLITLVVVGVLTAVAIIGIGGIVDKGHQSACRASMDAAKAATATHFARTDAYPQTFTAMTTTSPPEFEVPASAALTATTLKKGEWTLTLTPNGPNVATTYACT